MTPNTSARSRRSPRTSTAAPPKTARITTKPCPSNALELALWIESDRMGFLSARLDAGQARQLRDVVKNEPQAVDNVPYGRSEELIHELLFRRTIPITTASSARWPTSSAASLSDVSAFFRTYYAPNNASLTIAGDIDVSKTKALVEKYFGPLRGPKVERLKVDVPKLDALQAARRDRPRHPARAPCSSGRPSPSMTLDEPLDVLASVLGGLTRENRLYLARLPSATRRLGRCLARYEPVVGRVQRRAQRQARPVVFDALVALAEEEIARPRGRTDRGGGQEGSGTPRKCPIRLADALLPTSSTPTTCYRVTCRRMSTT